MSIDMVTNLVERTLALPGFTLFWTAIGAVIGGYGQHLYALRRDTRKEWNEIADPIRTRLQSEARAPGNQRGVVDESDLDQLRPFMRTDKMRQLRDAIKRCEQARHEHISTDSAGQRSYARTDHISDAALFALNLLQRR